MKRPAILLTTVIAMGMTASSVHAHHSHPIFYDQCKKITIEGRVESVQWKNPHVWIVLKMDNGTTNSAEWTSLQGLTSEGVAVSAQNALTVGARVAVTGNPLRDSAQIRASFPDYKDYTDPKTLDVIQIRRVDNNWSWSRTAPAECK